MYTCTPDKVAWNGKAIKGADVASFAPLTQVLARDSAQVYMLGKPAKVDHSSFEVLSPTFARDRTGVYLIMASKLKLIKAADAASFSSVGEMHGRDAHCVFCRDKRMRLRKGARPEDVTPLGFVYSHDGSKLFFGTQAFAPPQGADLNAADLKLRWFGECEINMPAITLTDGKGCWMRGLAGSREDWLAYEDADFESLAPIETELDSYWGAKYARDARQVWHMDQPIRGANPEQCSAFGQDMLSDGVQLWHGTERLPARVTEVTAIAGHYVPEQGFSNGCLLHDGAQITLHSLGAAPEILARAPQALPEWENGVKAVFQTLFFLFENYLPHQWTPFDVLRDMDETLVQHSALAECSFALTDTGALTVQGQDGVVHTRPASAWYSLACDLWAHVQGRAPSLLCYPALGIMYPRSTDLFEAILKRHSRDLRLYCAHVALAGHEQEADVLAYQCLTLTGGGAADLTKDALEDLVLLPRTLMPALGRASRNVTTISATTHLAFARALVSGGWLEAKDAASRIDAVSRLHAAILETGKAKTFWADIIPALVKRFEQEPMESVREHMAMALDAALIKGQVECEVSQNFHHDAMLPVIRLCLAHGINRTYNQARLVEALFATDAEDEAEDELQALIDDVGEDYSLPGVYCHRFVYRTPRLWVLRGRIDAAWRRACAEKHQSRLATLQSSFAELEKRYGKGFNEWEEVEDIREDLARYAHAVETG